MCGLPAEREERTVLAELLLDLRQIRAADDADVDVLPQLQHERRHLLRHHLPWHARGDAETAILRTRTEGAWSGAERADLARRGERAVHVEQREDLAALGHGCASSGRFAAVLVRLERCLSTRK